MAALVSVVPWVHAASPAAGAEAVPEQAAVAYDGAMARQVGADARGMRRYVLVVLKTGPTPVAKGPARDAMFAGHFANMERLADAGQLALAGPFVEDADGWRGLFVLAVDEIAQAEALVATDPVIQAGEMVAEYHRWYGSAAAMLVPGLHARLQAPTPQAAAAATPPRR